MTTDIPFAAFVGIDWADEQHAVALCLPDARQYEPSDLMQRAEDLDEWVAQLRTRFGGRPVAVCLEQSRGALIYALMKYECLVLFPINPKQLASYRDSFKTSRAKDDPTDARLLCQFLAERHSQLRPWRPDDETTRALRLLVEGRRRWVDQRTALGNQLWQQLKEVYPLAVTLAGAQVFAVGFLEMLVKFPSQKELQQASPKQLDHWLPKRRITTDEPSLEQQQRDGIAKLRAVPALVTDPAILQAGRLAVLSLAQMLQQLNQTIAQYDRDIAARLATHPDAELFQSLPGAGEVLVPRLIAAFGTDRERLESAEDLQELSGIAPVTSRSGKTCTVRKRRACPHFLRQTFHEFAGASIRFSRWAGAYYRMLRDRGTQHHAAVRALAFKWIRIIFRCWQQRTPYDEQRYLQQLTLKHAPLLAYLAPENSSSNP
jgi:transposase